MNIIVKMRFGSHLYGTDTPESDQDFKGIFLPSKEEILLNKIPKSISSNSKKGSETRNTSDDVDTEIYSLHYFIKLALEGQTVAIDMLHANEPNILEKSNIWDSIVENRSKFYTKSLKAFVGYARTQAAKYGIKGSRLNSVKLVIDSLRSFNLESRLRDYWNELPVGDYIFRPKNPKTTLFEYEVCGKKFQETAKVGYVLPILERFYKEYGKRAEMAAKNEGIDWKAVSHAVRAAFQTRQLLLNNNIIFPLKGAPLLLKIKKGELDYTTQVSPLLENLMEEVEDLTVTSNLPLHPDYKFWDKWMCETLEDNLFK